jgi:ribonucleoside-diphosphate reductase alpha chain
MRQIAEDVLRERYYQPYETCWEDLCIRVVTNVFPEDIEMRNKCKEMMTEFRFLPNSPTLMNSGTDIGQLSACFVLGIEDNMVSIFDTLKNAALIFKSGGGVGINFSYLRPKGAPVGSTLGTSSGVLSFMQVFNSMVETVKSGAVRRGAAIGILNCDHPEIEDFITSKNIEGKLSNFNISVMITDDFMEAVNHDYDWNLKFNDKIYKTIKARDLYNKIAESMWTRAEPGILYFDAINKDNMLTSKYGLIDSVNPCGEKTLVILRDSKSEFNNGGSSCNLGSLNLTSYVKDGMFYFYKFEKDIRTAVRFLDAVIDINKYPLKSIEYVTKDIREIGLGVMGYHDMLILMGISYDSEDAIKLENDIFKRLYEVAKNESELIAKENVPYPACDLEIPRRNSFLIAVAPTGTLSLFSNCSSGIEPNFAYVYDRSTTSSGEKKKYREVHPLFDSYMKSKYNSRYNEIVEHMFRYGTIQNCSYLNDDDKKLFKTAKDIDWKDHIKTQSTAQQWVDSSISKTVNMPNSATVENMKQAINQAWSSNLKGFTVYREGSRKDVVLETNATKKDESKVIEVTNPVQYKLATANGRILPKTPRDMPATVHKRTTACGKLYVIPAEAFDQLHSLFLVNKGGCDAMTQVIAELIGSMCRFGIPRWEITRICSGIVCPACRNKRKLVDGNSCADIIARVILENYPVDEEPPKCIEEPTEDTTEVATINKVPCPKCGEALIMQEGCRTCPSCGYSKCS